MSNKLKKIFLLSFLATTLAVTNQAYAAEEVNVYSGRKTKLIKPALDEFTEATGIKVNLLTGKSDGLLQRLLVEGKNSPGDILVTVDVGRLSKAKTAGLFQAINSDVLNTNIPDNLRDNEGYWYGLSQRARPIFYAKDKVDPSELTTYEALTDSKWKGRICIRSSSNIYNQSLIASMLAEKGEVKTSEFLTDFVGNFARKPAGGDTDQLRAVATGVCDIAIANTYYFGRLINSSKEKDTDVAGKIGLFWPNQKDRGVHVNVSGAGVLKHSKNPENAQKLIEFLASDDIQKWYAEVNNEFPVVANVKASETLQSWGDYRSDEVALSKLGELNKQAVILMDRAGWR